MKIKSISLNTIIIIAITLSLFVVSETVLRILFPEKINSTESSTEKSNVAFEFNEEYLVSPKPNIGKTLKRSPENGGDIIYWKTNKDSFRGDELKENSRIRIIVYGDSNIQARFSMRENTFVGRLHYHLQKKGIMNIEVVNAGVVGFGPDQSLIRFTKEADIYRPDLVVFHIFADNDFGDIIRNRLFELDKSGNLIKTGHRKTVDQLIKQQTGPVDFVSTLLIVRAAKKLYNSLRGKDIDKNERYFDVLQKLTNKEYSVYEKSEPRYYSHFADHYDLDVALFPEAESSKTKIKLMNNVLKRAREIADSKGIEFMVLIQPSVTDLTKNRPLSYDLQEYPGYKMSNLSDVVEKICRSNKIHFINLFDVFMNNDPESLHFKPDNNHWNDHGQDIAAREAALYIASKIMPDSHYMSNRSGNKASAHP